MDLGEIWFGVVDSIRPAQGKGRFRAFVYVNESSSTVK
jgi:hypothetical protein